MDKVEKIYMKCFKAKLKTKKIQKLGKNLVISILKFLNVKEQIHIIKVCKLFDNACRCCFLVEKFMKVK